MLFMDEAHGPGPQPVFPTRPAGQLLTLVSLLSCFPHLQHLSLDQLSGCGQTAHHVPEVRDLSLGLQKIQQACPDLRRLVLDKTTPSLLWSTCHAFTALSNLTQLEVCLHVECRQPAFDFEDVRHLTQLRDLSMSYTSDVKECDPHCAMHEMLTWYPSLKELQCLRLGHQGLFPDERAWPPALTHLAIHGYDWEIELEDLPTLSSLVSLELHVVPVSHGAYWPHFCTIVGSWFCSLRSW